MTYDNRNILDLFQPSQTIKRYHYNGHEDEKVPKDVTHVTIDESVEIIKQCTFFNWKYLCWVFMYDNVTTIEEQTFMGCGCLKFIRLSKTLKHIKCQAFEQCLGLEVIFLPNTIKTLGFSIFEYCRRLKMLQLPRNEEDFKTKQAIIAETKIEFIAKNKGIKYREAEGYGDFYTARSNRIVNKWLIHHMDDFPLHKICYSSSVTTEKINLYLNQHGHNSAQTKDTTYGMIPLHILSMNPYAETDTIKVLMTIKNETALYTDNDNMTPLDYATNFNFKALVKMMKILIK